MRVEGIRLERDLVWLSPTLRQREPRKRVERIGLQGNLPDPGFVTANYAKDVARLAKR